MAKIAQLSELRKMDKKVLEKKIMDSHKEVFENNQKLFRGEIKDYSLFRKERKNVARILTLLNETKENKK
jgi:ribosomal protein L29